ncbi:MAG: ribulose-phosphate 3-epimerase [Myxococcota bacterium]
MKKKPVARPADTMSKVHVFPSILSADFSRLGEQAQQLQRGGADGIHVDVMDGHFVPNLTMGPAVVEALRRCTELPLDVHLMVQDPDQWIVPFAQAGAASLTVHVESCTHPQRTLADIRRHGCKAGVALNPATSEEALRYVIGEVDSVLVMTVNPGFGGQEFLPSQLPKIAALREPARRQGNGACRIAVDGGINPQTAARAVAAGAEVLVAGSAVFGGNDVAAAIAALRGAG